MNSAELRAMVVGSQPLTFCREQLFSDECWAFQTNSAIGCRGTYRQFKNTISRTLDINPNNVAIVGSAKFGFSLSPVSDKAFKPFRGVDSDRPSDFDIVIVDPALFESIWDQLRTAYFNGYSTVRGDHGREAFFKFVSLKTNADYESTYLRKSQIVMDSMKSEVSKNHNVGFHMNYRIYDSWGAVEQYYTYSIQKVKAGS
jgi:hypothetical protein